MPVYKRLHQWVNAIISKFPNNVCPHYLNEVYEYAPQCRIESRSSFARLKVPFWKTNMLQKGLSYIGPSLWNNLPRSMKKATILNTFKHNLKKQYLSHLAECQDWKDYHWYLLILLTHLLIDWLIHLFFLFPYLFFSHTYLVFCF